MRPKTNYGKSALLFAPSATFIHIQEIGLGGKSDFLYQDGISDLMRHCGCEGDDNIRKQLEAMEPGGRITIKNRVVRLSYRIITSERLGFGREVTWCFEAL